MRFEISKKEKLKKMKKIIKFQRNQVFPKILDFFQNLQKLVTFTSKICKQKLQAEIASRNCKQKLQARFEFKTRQIMKLQ